MSEIKIGSIGWVDITCENTEALRDFYSDVAGWKPDPVDMGEYSDYNMLDSDGVPRSGICHKRGVNANLPTAWLIYIVVSNLRESMERCNALGGKVLEERIGDDGTGMVVIQDPAGAVCALYQGTPSA